MLSSDFHYKENDGTIGAAQLFQTLLVISPYIRRVRRLVDHRSLVFFAKNCSSLSIFFLKLKIRREY